VSISDQHINDQLAYEDLLKQYRELQLRVTRFSAIEQELINTRDRLDHELVLHQRLHRYNSDALKETDESSFFQIEAEAIVDVFEMEASIVLHLQGSEKQLTLYKEGTHTTIDSSELLAEAMELAAKVPSGKATLLSAERLNQHVFFSQFAHGVFSHFSEPALHYQVYAFGLISKTNAPLYNKPSDRHLTIFGVFTQQLQAMLANRTRSEAIKEQMERIRASQQELRKLSLIATRTKNGVIITDSMGHIEWVNEAFTKISGYALEEVIGKKPKDLLQGPKTDSFAREQLKEALWNKQNVEVTLINYDREGREYFNQLEIISVFNEEGEHTNFIALQKDITEEILARQEIIRINTRFELIAKHSRIGTWEYNSIDGSIRWNNIMFEIYGINENTETPLGQLWRNCMSHEDYEQGIANMNAISTGQKSTQESTFKIKRYSDGSERVLESLLVAERDDKGLLLRVVGSTKDITEEITLRRERDAAAERMVTLKTFYESVLNHSPSQKYVFDAAGRLLFCTEPPKEGALWLQPNFAKSIFEMEGSAFDSRTTNMIAHIRKSLEMGHIFRVEDEGLQNDGTKVEFLQSILPYYNNGGNLEHIIVTGVDISELKKVQEAVNRKNEELRKINAELDNFVYSISHDLRSPLLSIKGIVALILDSPNLDSKNRNYLQMVDGSATRLDSTIQEILEYSRNSRLDIAHEEFDVVSMVQQAYNDLRYSAEGQMELRLDIQTSPVVFTDRSRIGVLLKNILGNSIKYRKKDVAGFVLFRLKREQGHIIMEVSDNGEGIDSSHLAKIFTMFFRGTTSSIGTGLGLYICKEIVNKLNGDLSVASTLGEGTTMKITIPEITTND